MNEISGQTLDQLSMLAHRLSNDPSYIAWVLRSFQNQERMSDQQLEERLRISPRMLTRLALCKRPDSNSPDFGQQITKISRYVAIDPTDLAKMIRQVESLEALRNIPDKTVKENLTSFKSGLLAAARDRENNDEEITKNHNTEGDDATG